MSNLNAFDTKSAAYLVIRAALGDFRVTVDSPAAKLSAILTDATAHEAKHKAVGLADYIASLPVAVAGIGGSTVGAIVAGTANLCAPGDAGYVLSLIGVRGIAVKESDGSEVKRDGAIGLALYPAHSLDALLATDEARAWLLGIAGKEAGLIAFRGLRFTPGESTLAELEEAAKAMPLTVSDFTDRSRASTAESFAVFNDLWEAYRGILAAQPATAAVVAALPRKKGDILAAIRSQSYAARLFPALESAGIFVKLGNGFAHMARKTAAIEAEKGNDFPYDVDAMSRWIAGRDTLDLLPKVAESAVDLAAIDFSAFGA